MPTGLFPKLPAMPAGLPHLLMGRKSSGEQHHSKSSGEQHYNYPQYPQYPNYYNGMPTGLVQPVAAAAGVLPAVSAAVAPKVPSFLASLFPKLG